MIIGVHRQAQEYPLSAFSIGGVTRGCSIPIYLPCVIIPFSAQSTTHNRLKARSLWAGMAPKPGDRILVLRACGLDLVLAGEKTLESRSKNLSPGLYWIGTKGKIHGRVRLQAATQIHTAKALLLLSCTCSIDVIQIVRRFANSVICIVLTWMSCHTARPTPSQSVTTDE